jgi:hypothetical protein
MSEDLLTKLPAFLTAFDAVVLNDGSFEYVSQIVDELLQVCATSLLGRNSLPF